MFSARPAGYRDARADAEGRRMLAERHAPLAAAAPGPVHLDAGRDGAGLAIRWGWFETPFGEALVMGTKRGICGLGFTAETGREAALRDLAGRWPGATLTEAPEALDGWIAGLADGTAPAHLIGAPFQLAVWQALARVAPGRLATYGDLAVAVGRPGASRAVGTAVGRNPVSWLIPCHRAVRASGALGGYHWGLPVKRAMLAWEAEAFPPVS